MNTKFAFLLPLRNPNTAIDWDRCIEICKSTLRSACNQTASTSDYEVVLVCKDFPEFNEYPNLKIIRGDFSDPQKTWEDQHRDKYDKFRCGLEYLSKYESLYVMKLDADDLVSKKIVSYVIMDNNKRGYYIEKGYEYSLGKNYIKPLVNFTSGNSLLKENVFDSDLMKLGHHATVTEFNNRGTPLSPIPFQAAIYKKDHGENLTSHYTMPRTTHNKPNLNYYIGNLLKIITEKRTYINKGIKHEFSF